MTFVSKWPHFINNLLNMSVTCKRKLTLDRTLTGTQQHTNRKTQRNTLRFQHDNTRDPAVRVQARTRSRTSKWAAGCVFDKYAQYLLLLVTPCFWAVVEATNWYVQLSSAYIYQDKVLLAPMAAFSRSVTMIFVLKFIGNTTDIWKSFTPCLSYRLEQP